MSRLFCFLAIAIALGIPSAAIVADEVSGNSGRPARFLMLLKPGTKISWNVLQERRDYWISILTEEQFNKRREEQRQRKSELESLSKEFGGPNALFSANDVNPQDPEFQKRAKAFQRFQELRRLGSYDTNLGRVTFVGDDYIAVVRTDSEGGEQDEMYLPAWTILRIRHYRETAETPERSPK